jgi:1-acyl-sn-glycerol-3-phosphate acyltransferase
VNRTSQYIVGFIRLLLGIFFRRIEVTGFENVPAESGGLILSWHPNGVVDAALILTHFPKPIVFGARHGIFKWPLLGWMMRQLGMVPIYRRSDMRDEATDAERQASNRRSIDALAQAIADGGYSALFPEGLSHDEPFLMNLKKGAAYLYLRAAELTPDGAPRPVILPVGLHYNKKRILGSQALVAIHPPLEVEEELAVPAPLGEERRGQAARLTDEFERVLNEVVLATESWELHNLMHRARKLIRAEGVSRRGAKLGAPDMAERVRHFGSLWRHYAASRESHPDETTQLVAEVASYDEELSTLGIEDHELDGTSWLASPRRVGLLVLQMIVVYLILPPFLVIGVLVNLPTALLLWVLTKGVSKKYKDEASVKILAGAVLFPLTWLLVALLVGWGERTLAAVYPQIPDRPVLTAIVAFLLSAFGGLLALQYRRLAGATLRAVRVGLTRARRSKAVHRLKAKRSRLFDEFLALDKRLAVESEVIEAKE